MDTGSKSNTHLHSHRPNVRTSPSLIDQSAGFLCLAVLALCTASGAAQADDCKPDFGDKLYEWVQKDSNRQALALAERDFVSRATNGRIVEYDSLLDETTKLSAVLDGYADQARIEFEILSGQPPSLAQAVVMQSQTSDALTQLVKAGGTLLEMQQRLEVLAAEPRMEQFVAEGAHHIGRSTLLESITPLGRPNTFSLNSRYAFYVKVDFDTEGKANKGDGGVNGPEYLYAADQGAIYILNYGTEAISRTVALAYLFIRVAVWGHENEECQKKVREQEARAAEAVKFLSTTLPTGTTTFALFTTEQRRGQVRFSAVQMQFEENRKLLNERWRGLMAVNLARANLAASVLTAEKLETLRKAYNTTEPLAHIFDSTALTNLLLQVGALQSSIIDREVQVADACHDLSGLRVAEDLIDSKRVGTSALAQLQRVARFAPVLPTIERVRLRIERPVPRAEAILQGAANVACNNGAQFMTSTFTRDDISIPNDLLARKEPKSRRLAQLIDALDLKKVMNFIEVAFNPLAQTDGSMFCVIVKVGMSYECRKGTASGGSGGTSSGNPPLSDELGNGENPRYSDVSSGVYDGGFSKDSATASETIEAAKANIEQRIRDLSEHQSQIEKAVPAWLSSSDAGMKTAVSQQQSLLGAEINFRTVFFMTQDVALKNTVDRLNKFAKESGDSKELASLVKDSGVVDTSLPGVPPEAFVPDMPPLAGLLPATTHFPAGSSLMQQNVAREAAKGESIPEGEAKKIHGRLIIAAERLTSSKTPAADALAESILQDALAQRYSKETISVISDDGVVSRIPFSGGPLPSNSLLAHLEAFEYKSNVVGAQIAVARQALSSDAVDREPRLRALEVSNELLSSAQKAFYGGSFLQGEGLLEIAGIVADLVTSWTPGISWARDIYESVSGKDLISGKTLENWERGAAILGAITAGVGSKGPKVLHAFRALEKAGLDLKRAEHIVETARRIDSMSAKPSVHALERMAGRGIDVDEVENVLDTGSRFFDVFRGGIACVEDGVADGAARIVVIVDADKLVDADHMLIRTVHRKELRTDKELIEAMVEGTNDVKRFIPLPD